MSRTVSEIEGDFGRKHISTIFPVCLTGLEFCNAVWSRKYRVGARSDVYEVSYIEKCFDTVPVLPERWTDERTDR